MDEASAALRVVVVEDHQLLVTTLALALSQRGVEVHTPVDHAPDTIVGTVRSLAPVLVLLDLDLGPALGSGLDLIRDLIDAGGRVVMMTGVADRTRLAECLEAGAIGIVSKTEGFGDLVDAVTRAAAGEELLTNRERQGLIQELGDRRAVDHQRSAPFASLSPREQVVLAGLVAGQSAEAIAEQSYVSLPTVRTQIRSILVKLGVRSQLAAVALARDAGWASPPD
jgi:DNA-binding NarL/FixJ family response regulator